MVSMEKREVRTYSKDAKLVDKRRSEIVVCASTVFIRKGYDRTTMSELAKAFGMSKGGMYHYIGSKEDILYLILKFNAEKEQELFEAIGKKTVGLRPTEALEKAIDADIDTVDEFQDMYLFINHVMPNLGSTERHWMFNDSERVVHYFEQLVREGIVEGEFRSDDPWFTASDIVVLCHQWANRRWILRKKFSLEAYKERVRGHALNMLRSS